MSIKYETQNNRIKKHHLPAFSTLPAWAKPSAPISIHLVVTRVCNWSCEFCTIPLRNSRAGFANEATLIAIVEKLAQAGVMDVNLFGGEPLLHPKAVSIGAAIREHGMKPGFITNGNVSLPTKELFKIFPRGSISIHGPEKVHDDLVRKSGAWRTSINFLRKYVEAGGEACVSVTVGQKNLDTFAEFCLNLAEQIPVSSFVINPVTPFQGVKMILDHEQLLSLTKTVVLLEKKLRQKHINVNLNSGIPFCAIAPEAALLVSGCSAGSLFATVDYLGDIYVCHESHTPIGNIFESDLAQIWQKNGEYELLATAAFADVECKKCEAYPWCLGGCRRTRSTSFPTTDTRMVGSATAARNIEFLSRSKSSMDSKEKVPEFIRLHPDVRMRLEPFGMFVNPPNGHTVALDYDGTLFMSHFLNDPILNTTQIGKLEGFQMEKLASFIQQGLNLGVFTDAEKGGRDGKEISIL